MGKVILTGKRKLFIKEGGSDYLVKNGTVLVRLQPFEGMKNLRQIYLGTAGPGDLIPAPGVDAGKRFAGAGKQLSFLIVVEAENKEAELEEAVFSEDSLESEGAAPAYSFFQLSEEAGFTGTPQRKEDFREIIYRSVMTARDEMELSLKRYEEEKQKSRAHIGSIIAESFQNAVTRHGIRLEQNDRGIYDAASFLCHFRGIEIIPYARLKQISENPDELSLEDIARLSGFSFREAELAGRWMRNKDSAFIAFLVKENQKSMVVVFPRGGKLYIYDPAEAKIRRFIKEEDQIEKKVLYFDRPFKTSPVTFKEVVLFAAKEISVSDIVVLLISMLLLSYVGVALTVLHQNIYDQIIPRQNEYMTYLVGAIFLATLAANFLFSVARNLTDYRLNIKATNAVQMAIFHRVFHLPEQFFKGKESAAQAYRITQLSSTYMMVLKNGLNILTGFIFSLVYLLRMFKCSPVLAEIGLAVALAGIVVTFTTGILQQRLSRTRMQKNMGIRSFLYQTVAGIGTIRMGGAEDAVLERYMEKEGGLQELQGKLDRIHRRTSLAVSALNACSMLLIYWNMGSGRAGNVTIGVFMGFITANAMFSSQILQVASALSSVIIMIPIMKDTGELLMTIPETGNGGQILSDFRGDIRLSEVSYGYKGSGRTVLKNLSLHIKPGEYVGIVGESGCGKSTLMRLLLAFASPDKGQIYYDDVPLNKINPVELRRSIGTVLQDGSLVSGTILQNIRIANPAADRKAVEEAVEIVGLKDEINAMPMGLMTHVSEDALTISGGQKQRILIARAIIGAPKLLLFDEATSSLDNNAQETISNALYAFNATRIVIAHRLSTVKLCDRILFMEDGRITESGTYDELMQRKGSFYEMVKIQQAV